MLKMSGGHTYISVIAILFSAIAIVLSGWNFYVLGTWTSYWLDGDVPEITACEAYFETADALVLFKAQELKIATEEGVLPAFPDVFFSNTLGHCVALFTFYDDADQPTDYGYNVETGDELKAEDVVTIFDELIALLGV